MNNEKIIKSDQILESLDGCRSAGAPAFFYTRLKARMEKEILPPEKRRWILQPVYILGLTVALVAVNAFLVLTKKTDSSKAEITATQQNLAAEYNLNESNTIYDLNQEK